MPANKPTGGPSGSSFGELACLFIAIAGVIGMMLFCLHLFNRPPVACPPGFEPVAAYPKGVLCAVGFKPKAAH